jgi:hypothetical protein
MDKKWFREFDEPITLPGGGELRTLSDAREYIRALAVAKRTRQEWQTARQLVLRAGKYRGSITFAKIAIRRALDPHIRSNR